MLNNFYFKKKSVPFNERMAGIKSLFQQAHDSASTLHKEMEEEIEAKNALIEALQGDIETINVTKAEAETFMNNLKQFIG